MSDDYSLHARVVSPGDLMDITNALAQSQSLSILDIRDVIDKDEQYVRALLQLGSQLDLVEETDSGYSINSSIAIEVRQASTSTEKREVLRIKVRRYRPFTTFVRHLVEDESLDQAANLVKIFYQLGSDVDKIKRQLIELGEYTGIFSIDGTDIELNFDTSILSNGYFRGLSDALEDELVARLYLENRLNEDLVAFVDQECFEDFVEALQLFGNRPDSAVAASYRAVETFQRKIGHSYGNGEVDYSGPSGVRQLAQAMETDNLTRDRHQLAGELIGEIRNNTGGHGVDAETNKHWRLSGEVAFSYILTSIHYIRSLYHWVVDDQLVV